MRIDKWLWVARFYKTRSLASQAVDNGKVELNGGRVKPAKEVRAGDKLDLRIGEYTWLVTVKELSERRGPAAQATMLYEEDVASRERRTQMIADRKTLRHPAADAKGRPTKKQRRQIQRFIRDE